VRIKDDTGVQPERVSNRVEKLQAGQEPLRAGSSGSTSRVICGFEQSVHLSFNLASVPLTRCVDPQQDGLLRQGSGPRLGRETLHDTAAAVSNLEEGPT
jgi:hypothetical protein